MRHSPYPVVLDACVLYPARLRDLLMHLGITGLYQPKWSRCIHDEWCRNLRENRPDIQPVTLNRTVELMNMALPDANITGYKHLIAGLTLPDPDDCHVLAAAIRAKAEVIVTLNLRDFPPGILASFDIEALHPDDFISALPSPSSLPARPKPSPSASAVPAATADVRRERRQSNPQP